MDLHFIAPLPALRKRTRLAKMATAFVSLGARIVFHGWERVPGEAKELEWAAPEISESTILCGGGYSSPKARALYPIWMLVVFLRTLKIGRRKTIFCLGWETAFPALIAAKFTKSTIIFDDADRFSLIFKLPRHASAILKKLEQWASRQAFLHVVPSFSRYEWRRENMLPLRNTPLREDFDAASQVLPTPRTSALVIYANGWLGDTRGAAIFLALANNILFRKIEACFIIAGRIDSVSGNSLIAHPLVKFQGEIEQVRALALYRQSDVVLTYYDPSISINRKAESNKWGDCVYFGVPFVVNKEVETAYEFVDAGAAFAVEYHDVEGLTNLIDAMQKDRSILREASTRLGSFRSEFPIFDEQLKNIFNLISKKNACTKKISY